ncbi:MAG: hypothetical protein H7138_20905 [Myxococcales bacterium]|nr:hypothetical protein [Myxococcales bacterium]
MKSTQRAAVTAQSYVRPARLTRAEAHCGPQSHERRHPALVFGLTILAMPAPVAHDARQNMSRRARRPDHHREVLIWEHRTSRIAQGSGQRGR